MELFQGTNFTKNQILENPKLLDKAQGELRLSTDHNKSPRDLLEECIQELEEKGFLNLLENTAETYLYQIRDQKDKLKNYII